MARESGGSSEDRVGVPGGFAGLPTLQSERRFGV